MFIEFKNLYVAFGKFFPLAIVYFNKCDGERFLKEQGKAKLGKYSCFSPLIAIVDYVPQKASCQVDFSEYRILNKEEENDVLDTLKRSNLTINDKGFISFLDYKKICFEVDENILPYDDFCKYELPEGKVFKTVFDNGYSYYGQNLLRVMPKSTPIQLSELPRRLAIFGLIGEWVSDLIIFST